jgi:hypothetical protein
MSKISKETGPLMEWGQEAVIYCDGIGRIDEHGPTSQLGSVLI